jgi:hypothetical protein
MGIPKLVDVAEPTQLVEAYSKLSPGEYVGKLAPSLGLLIEHELFDPRVIVSDEFSDTITFLSITHLDPMLDALKMVNSGLKVVREAPVALSLTQEMGFGKTHFLTLLWHLYAQTYRWNVDELRNIYAKIDIDRRVAERAVVFAIDLLRYPMNLKPYDAIFEISARILERKYKAHGIGLLDPSSLRNLSRLKPMEAAKTLISILKEVREPLSILVIIDELYAGVNDVIMGGSDEIIRSFIDLISFFRDLLELSKGVVPLVFIYASAQQDVDRWSRLSKNVFDGTKMLLIESVNELNERVERLKPSTLKTPEIKDILNILTLRLLRFKTEKEKVIRTIQEYIKKEYMGLIGEDEVLNFIRRLNEFYPFSPSYETLLLKLTRPTFGADLPKSQHIRDLLRATASIIARLSSTKWSESMLISIAHLMPEDIVHTMDEHIAREWMRIYESCKSVIGRIGDEEIRELMLAMLSTVYTKSVTGNVVKLLDLMKAPHMQSRDEIQLRGSTKLDIAMALMGAIPEKAFKKFDNAFERFKGIPYLNSIEYGGLDYYLITLLPNPSELVNHIAEEERERAGIDKCDYNVMLEYFKSHLINQYSLSSFFNGKSQREAPPKLQLIDWKKHIVDFKDKPIFINLLDRNLFTILTVSPWSILEASLLEKTEVDYVNKTKDIINEFKNEIPYINMFAIVLPKISLDDLQKLCSEIASVNAASTAISYLKVGEPEQAKRKRLDIIKKEPTIPTLKEYFKSEQEFESILLEIIEQMHRKIESYAVNLASSAISNYTADLISLFRTVVYYDPKTGMIVHTDLSVAPSPGKAVKEFKDLYGELPSWIINAVCSKCNVKRVQDIRTSLIEYIKKYAIKGNNKSMLLKGMKLELDALPIIESIARGWPEIPIKPISKDQILSAIKQLSNVYILEDPDINEIVVSIEDTKIFIGKVEEHGPPPPPDEEYDRAEIRGINNVMIAVAHFEKLKDELSNVKAVDFSASIGGGNINLSRISIDVVKVLKLDDVLRKFVNNISNVSITLYFEEKMKKEKILEWFRKVGIDERMLRLKKPGE